MLVFFSFFFVAAHNFSIWISVNSIGELIGFYFFQKDLLNRQTFDKILLLKRVKFANEFSFVKTSIFYENN